MGCGRFRGFCGYGDEGAVAAWFIESLSPKSLTADALKKCFPLKFARPARQMARSCSASSMFILGFGGEVQRSLLVSRLECT